MPEIKLNELVFTRQLETPGAVSALYRRRAAGEYRLLTRGAFLPAPLWESATEEERHRAELLARTHLDRDLVFCAQSAALAWRRPLIGPAPSPPQVLALGASGRTGATVRRFAAEPDVEQVDLGDGVVVTTLARTVVDTARNASFLAALAVADHALSSPNPREQWPARARVGREELLGEVERGSVVRSRRAAFVVNVANGDAGSPGESMSRVLIAQAGFPAPLLQQRFDDHEGLVGYADFYWPEYGLVGEFDGVAKYVREEFSHGRAPADVVLAEKWREDRLRALGLRVVRWGWSHLTAPSRFEDLLLRAGLPRLHRGRRQWTRPSDTESA